MEFSRLSSILAMIGAVNIFYAMYGLIQRDWVNTLIPIVTYFILIYSAAILDSEAEDQRLARSAKWSSLSENYMH